MQDDKQSNQNKRRRISIDDAPDERISIDDAPDEPRNGLSDETRIISKYSIDFRSLLRCAFVITDFFFLTRSHCLLHKTQQKVRQYRKLNH